MVLIQILYFRTSQLAFRALIRQFQFLFSISEGNWPKASTQLAFLAPISHLAHFLSIQSLIFFISQKLQWYKANLPVNSKTARNPIIERLFSIVLTFLLSNFAKGSICFRWASKLIGFEIFKCFERKNQGITYNIVACILFVSRPRSKGLSTLNPRSVNRKEDIIIFFPCGFSLLVTPETKQRRQGTAFEADSSKMQALLCLVCRFDHHQEEAFWTSNNLALRHNQTSFLASLVGKLFKYSSE